MKERIEKTFRDWPKLKKVIGVVLIVYGFIALLTPFTPGSWLVFVGLEVLGFDLVLWDKFKIYFKKIFARIALWYNASMKNNGTEIAVFGGGCFWCTEAVFKMLRGVSSVLPGYAGGATQNPTYEQVSGGKTGHAEVVRVEFDPAQVKYRDLLTVLFASHDPTTKNRQGNDVGPEYRSVIFYTTPEQKKTAEEFIKEINASNEHGAPIVTELQPLDTFYEAENYHRDYFATHPGNPYCELVINPKLEKVQKQFVELLKTGEKQNKNN